LSLTGVIIKTDVIRDLATPRLNSLKLKYFPHDVDSPIVLHRKDLVNKRHPFHTLKNPDTESNFNAEFLKYLSETPFSCITVVIDKWQHLQKYVVWQEHPYHYCMEVLLEKYVLWLKRNNARGDVLAEVRGKSEDVQLKECYRRFYVNGSDYASVTEAQAFLTSKELKLKRKQENITGLQIADSIAHPSAEFTREYLKGEQFHECFGKEIARILEASKYVRSPWVGKLKGWGVKWLP